MIFAEKLAGFSHDDEVASGAARRFVDATFFSVIRVLESID